MRAAIGLIIIVVLGCGDALFAQTTPLPRNSSPVGGDNAAYADTSTGARQSQRTEPVFSRQAVFAIPFSVAEPNRHALEVLLFVSADGGATWDLYARESAAKGQFGFHAGRDGEYWFASRTVPIGTNLPGHSRLTPELKVSVDTTEPKLDVNASVNRNGEIEVAWSATDGQLAADSLKIEYQSALGQPWKSANIERPAGSQDGQTMQGQSAWAADGGGRFVSIRVQVSDKAGNVGQAIRRLLVPTTVAGNASNSPRSHLASDVPQDPLGSHGLMSEHTAQLPPNPTESARRDDQTADVQNDYNRSFGSAESGASDEADSFVAADNRSRTYGPHTYDSGTYGTDTVGPDTYASNAYKADSNNLEDESEDVAGDEPERVADATPEAVSWPSDSNRPPMYGEPRTGFASSANDYQDSESLQGTYVANRTGVSQGRSETDDPQQENATSGTEADSSGYGLPPGERPRMTSSTRFNLAYSVDAAGPMGLEKVELWVTRNGGRDWNLWGLDEDMESPFLVEVEDEGAYGFRVVLVSKNGLASQTPRSGDLADLWVGIDTTDPVAEITTAAYGEGGHAGNLDIQWTATDDHFGQRPITFSFSEKRDGPWTTIASGLPNSGQYYWRVDSSVPDKFYLRLEARDEAGNLCIDQLKRPIQSAGLTPKGRVRSFEPLSE
jgi:hypothetical protein